MTSNGDLVATWILCVPQKERKNQFQRLAKKFYNGNTANVFTFFTRKHLKHVNE